MGAIVNNQKGFKVLKLEPHEALAMGMGTSEGCICMECNGIIEDSVYYVAVLNDCMCEDCYTQWYKRSHNYEEDREIETKNFNYYYGRYLRLS